MSLSIVHSVDDGHGWRGPDSKQCRKSTGGAATSTEPVQQTGPEAESKATRCEEHPRDRFHAARTPSSVSECDHLHFFGLNFNFFMHM